MFKRQYIDSSYGKCVTVTERVLLDWYLKNNTTKRLTVKLRLLVRGFCLLWCLKTTQRIVLR